jgi:hypothetical protein
MLSSESDLMLLSYIVPMHIVLVVFMRIVPIFFKREFRRLFKIYKLYCGH